MSKKYKKYEKKSGVYRIQNIKTGNFYIGSTIDLYKRYARHRYVLKNELKENIRMHEDFIKHGLESFIFGVIEYCEKDKLLEKEQYYYEKLMPFYNVWKSIYSAKGREYTKEQLEYFNTYVHGPKDIEKHSNILKKSWKKRKEKYSVSELHKKMSEARKGIKHSEETKIRYSIERKGKPKSEEMKQRLRKARLGTKLINGKFVKL